jgi:hypothetical protein
MKKKKFIYALVALMLFLSSCTEEILDKKPLDIISDETLWESPELIKTYVNGIYKDLSILYFDNDVPVFSKGPWFTTEVLSMGDECSPNWPGHSVPKYGDMRETSTFLSWWGYGAIRKMNVLIDKLSGETNLPDEDKNALIAETRFLRAYSYFHMAKLFGGVPLITKAQSLDDPEEELYPPRNKEQEVYDFILSELDEIIPDLPENIEASEFGRPSKMVAYALKSRAAMYAASISTWGTVQINGVVGIPSELATTYWQQSYDASKAIMAYSSETGKIRLFNNIADKAENFRQIFLQDRHEEVIWAKSHIGEPGGPNQGDPNLWNLANSPRNLHPWIGGHDNAVYLDMVDEFENVDGTSGVLDKSMLENGMYTIAELFGQKEPRFFGSVYTENTDYYGSRVRMYRGVIDEDGTLITSGTYNNIPVYPNTHGLQDAFGVLKYCTGNAWPQGNDIILIRYAEILLNFAEAAFELGKTGEALLAVNEIRDRAGVPALTGIDREKIRHERKVELAFENHRYWDVRRWRIATEVLSVPFSTLQFTLDYTSYAQDPFNAKYKVEVVPADLGKTCVFKPENYYFPITPGRISNNSNLIENPSY